MEAVDEEAAEEGDDPRPTVKLGKSYDKLVAFQALLAIFCKYFAKSF